MSTIVKVASPLFFSAAFIVLGIACGRTDLALPEVDAAVLTALPDGAVVLPDGAVVLPDGGVLLPDGAVVPPDGPVTLPDGAVKQLDGNVTQPDGRPISAADGETTPGRDAAT